MTQEERFINSELLRLRREERGWVLSDMALRACMSVKQIRQLEEGGTSAFYSEAVKLTAAKKAAAVLGLSEHEVFALDADAEVPQVDEPALSVPEVHVAAEPAPIAETATTADVASAAPVVEPGPSCAHPRCGANDKATVCAAQGGCALAAIAAHALAQPAFCGIDRCRSGRA